MFLPRNVIAACVWVLGLSVLVWQPLSAKEQSRQQITELYDAKKALQYSQSAIGQVLEDYRFTDSNGREIRLSDFRGRPLIISMVYTSCHHVCPTATRELARVVKLAQDALKADSFNVVTIGFDSYNDTPHAMRIYAAQQNVNLPGWTFLSSDQATIDRLAKKIGFIYVPSPKGFDHLLQATIVDSEGRVYRQVYGGSIRTPLLIEPLLDLVYGRAKTQSVVESIGNRIRLFCTVYDPMMDTYTVDYSIFIGMFIGISSLLAVAFWLVREWRSQKS